MEPKTGQNEPCVATDRPDAATDQPVRRRHSSAGVLALALFVLGLLFDLYAILFGVFFDRMAAAACAGLVHLIGAFAGALGLLHQVESNRSTAVAGLLLCVGGLAVDYCVVFGFSIK